MITAHTQSASSVKVKRHARSLGQYYFISFHNSTSLRSPVTCQVVLRFHLFSLTSLPHFLVFLYLDYNIAGRGIAEARGAAVG